MNEFSAQRISVSSVFTQRLLSFFYALAGTLIFLGMMDSAIALPTSSSYTPRGIGGGGALASFAISPYSKLRLVGTDMGTLFRSVDGGKNWSPIRQSEVKFGSDLNLSTEIGFSSDGKSVFFADQGSDPKRSLDSGVSWQKISIPLPASTKILYFLGSPADPKRIYCGTSDGFYTSRNLGDTWIKVTNTDGKSVGTTEISIHGKNILFHANEHGILISKDEGKTFQNWYHSDLILRGFAGGSDDHGATLVFSDSDGDNACAWAKRAKDSNAEQIANNLKDCGWIWTSHFNDLPDTGLFSRSQKEAGRFIKMAVNDSRTIYVTGGDWVRQYGNKVWVSKDAGLHYSLVLQLYDWDQHPYAPWRSDHLEYSAVGLDVGWDDNAPTSFAINLKNSSEIGSTGFYFLHTSDDSGEHWHAPFTHFADSGARAKGKRWSSTGLEVSSVLKLKFHPKNPKLAYASVADLGGLVTEDGGNSFRISKAKYNTNYDYAFDPSQANLVFAASGSRHDFPLNTNTPLHEEGGIFASDNRGKSWRRLTPDSKDFNRQFLSVAYDPIHHVVYGGTEGGGIAKGTDGGKQWVWLNQGLPAGDAVIPQIEIDPKDGTPYALLSGNAPDFNNADFTGIYRLEQASGANAQWHLLRKKIDRPAGVDPKFALWQFPSSFAIDFSNPNRSVLWLSDIENKGAWLATGAWKSVDGGDTWKRMVQSTHPTAISIHPLHPNEVIVSGLYDVSGKWGKGGALISKDSGTTFQKNEKLPLEANLFHVVPDPNHPENGFFLFFGGGIYYGPLG